MMEEIQNKLNDLQNKLQALRSKRYQDGQNEYESLILFIERIIDRLYPERQATELKKKLFMSWGSGNTQKDYVIQIDLAIRVIDTIKGEDELFGLDDFKPLKEKVKTEWQLGSEKIGAMFKKTKEK
jgi:hypothetical protein